MEAKTKIAYDAVINYLKTVLVPTLNPSIIITDYETALRDSLFLCYPNAQAYGCYFHHNQVCENTK